MFHWFDTVRHGLAGFASSTRRTRHGHKRSRSGHFAASASSRYNHHALVEPLEQRQLLTVGVPELVYDVSPGAPNSSLSLLGGLNGELLFAETVTSGLWKSNGASSGTTLLKDFVAMNADAGVVGGTLYFEAWDGANDGYGNRLNKGLWKSDGTSSGTVFVQSIDADPIGPGNESQLNFATCLGGDLIVVNSTGPGPWFPYNSLLKISGTTGGLIDLKTFFGGYLGTPVGVGGTLFFTVEDGSVLPVVNQLWKSDGTSSGTVLVKDFGDDNSSYIGDLTNVNGTLFFVANDGVNGSELWKSNGTSSGTVMVKDIRSGAANSILQGPLTNSLMNVGGTLYFQANDGVTGYELWKSTGTSNGTVRVRDINSGSSNSNATPQAVLNNKLYFTATNGGTGGNELWTTTGTSAGTVIVRDIASGAASSTPLQFMSANGRMFFSANTSSTGRELWTSNGASTGTQLVANINPGAASGFILSSGAASTSLAIGDLFYFVANDGVHGNELWKVTNVNLPPTAPGAGGPYVISEGNGVFLSGVASSDPDDDPLTYSWDINGDNVFGDVIGLTKTLSWSTLTSLGISAGGGPYTVRVQVDDGYGHVVVSAPTTLTINNLPPTITSVSNFNIAAAGANLNLSVIASDPGGGPITLNWDLNGDDVFGDAVGASPSLTPAQLAALGVGTTLPWSGYVRVRATDSFGAATTSAPIGVLLGPIPQSLGSISVNVIFPDLHSPAPVLGSQIWIDGSTGVVTDGTLAGTRAFSADSEVVFNGRRYFRSYWSDEFETHAQVYSEDPTVVGDPSVLEWDGPIYSSASLFVEGNRLFWTAQWTDVLYDNATDLWELTATGPVLIGEVAHSFLPDIDEWASPFQFGGHSFVERRLRSYGAGNQYTESWAYLTTPSGLLEVANAFSPSSELLPLPYSKTLKNAADIQGVLYLGSRNRPEQGPGYYAIERVNLTGTPSLTTVADGKLVGGAGGQLFFTSGGQLYSQPVSGGGTTNLGAFAAVDVAYRRSADFGGALYFWANDGVHGKELWKSDGTLAGTQLALEFTPGSADTESGLMQVLSDSLLVEANGNLYRTDGTTAGTTNLTLAALPGYAWTSIGEVNGNLLVTMRNRNQTSMTGRDVYVLPGVTNSPPTADAGGPYVAQAGDGVALSAAASSDPDPVDVLTYTWDINGDGTFGDATGVNPSLTWSQLAAAGISAAPAAYNVRVRVDDGHGHIVDSPTTTLTITAGAEIGVAFGAVQLTDGDTSPTTTDGSDFGAPAAGVAPIRQWTITNTGPGVLDLSGGVTITGPNAGDFSVTTPPAVTSLASGQSTTFRVRFAPIAGGVRNATVLIHNNDVNESPFDFAVTGIGSASLTPAEIDVTVDATSIPDGGTAPAGSGATGWNYLPLGTGVTRDFSVTNAGTAGLLLTGTPIVTITGPNAADFSVITMPGPQIRGLGASVMAIRFAPTAIGVRTATVTIVNSDSDENPYDFTITGVGGTAITASGTGGYRGEERSFTFTTADASTTAGFRYDIDWDNDGTIDQTFNSTSSSQAVPHVSYTSGTQSLRVTITDLDDNSAGTATLPVTTTDYALRPNEGNPALMDLVWGGSAGDDSVVFTETGADSVSVQKLLDDGVVMNDTQPVSGVTGRVVAYGNPGNDSLDGSGLSTKSATLDGGAGNNTLRGGNGGDILIGGTDGAEGGPSGQRDGSNVIIAGNGTNTIYGNAPVGKKEQTGGDNIIIGGTGSDTIYGNYGVNNQPLADGGEGGHNIIIGGAGADTLYTTQSADGGEGSHGSIAIAGSTTYGNSPSGIAALQSILAEWSSGHATSAKLAYIQGTGGPGGLNGTNYLTAGGTVLSDAAVDTIFGDTNGSAHWFFYRLSEDLLNRTKTDDILSPLP